MKQKEVRDAILKLGKVMTVKKWAYYLGVDYIAVHNARCCYDELKQYAVNERVKPTSRLDAKKIEDFIDSFEGVPTYDDIANNLGLSVVQVRTFICRNRHLYGKTISNMGAKLIDIYKRLLDVFQEYGPLGVGQLSKKAGCSTSFLQDNRESINSFFNEQIVKDKASSIKEQRIKEVLANSGKYTQKEWAERWGIKIYGVSKFFKRSGLKEHYKKGVKTGRPKFK